MSNQNVFQQFQNVNTTQGQNQQQQTMLSSMYPQAQNNSAPQEKTLSAFSNESNIEFDKNEILELFSRVKKETDNAKRQELEKTIKILKQNVLGLVDVSTKILLDPSIPKDSNVHLVLINLKNVLEKKIENREITYKHDIVILLEKLFPIINLIGHFDKKINEIIGLIFSIILKSGHVCSDSKSLGELMLKCLENFKNERSIETFRSLYYIIYNIFNADIPDSVFLNLVSIAKNSLDAFAEYTNQVLVGITSIGNESEIEYFTTVIDLKKKFFEILFLTSMKLKKADKFSGDNKNEFIICYLDYSIDSISYESRDGSIISFTGNKQIDSAINGMKEKSFMWISMLIQYESTDAIYHEKLIEKSILLFKLITDTFKFLIKNKMGYLAKMSGISNEFTDNEYNSIIFQANLFLSRVLIREPMISTMVSNIKEFLFEIIIPMVITTESEYLKMKTDGENHHGFFIDILGDYVSHFLFNIILLIFFSLIKAIKLH